MIKAALTVLLISLLMCTSAFAGGSGNCVQPLQTTTDDLGVGGAFEFNYVDSRYHDLFNQRGPEAMKVEQLSQVYGKVIFGYDNFNIYGKIGGCNYDLEFIDRAQDAAMVIDLKRGIYTGAGINALFPLMDIDNLSIGFDVQGNFFYNDVEGITRDTQVASAIDGAFYGIDGQESVYVAYEFEMDEIKTSIVPYVGIYHSWIIVGTAEALAYETRKTGYVEEEHFQATFDPLGFGLLLGLDLDIATYVNLNVEGRFIGETAITTGVTIKF